MSKGKNNLLQISAISVLLGLSFLEIINTFELLGDAIYLRELFTGGDFTRPRDGFSSQDFMALILIMSISIWLYSTNKIKTTVIPEEVAVKLVQKAKVAEKKVVEAEKKVAEAEKKVAEVEKKAEEEEDLDFDDFDDFDDVEKDSKEELEEVLDEPKEEEIKENIDQSKDIELDQLLELATESEKPEDRSIRLIAKGDLSGALEVWKNATIKDGNNSKYWRGLANVLDLMDQPEKSKTAQKHADRIDSKAIAEKTGRKMEDILADLLDDGILNFSAGSDSMAHSAVETSSKDDLTKLPGIGSVSAQRLNKAGIDTFLQVSNMDDSQIKEIIKSKKLEAWSEMAKTLSDEG